jgi:glyoxylase-like metal-dependent hydrolase (beta-lactamase superfamily II)
MILRQLLHHDPVIAASYLVGCTGKGMAAIIDPVADPPAYMDLAAASGTAIRFVIDTHLHADHVSTGPALAALAGAEYVLHESARAAFGFRRVRDGELLEVGNVALRVLHLPGHTPEHLGLVATDRTRADRPWLAFTGHTLMVGDMGRTELATTAEEGARALFRSARTLSALPDDVMVLPGAFAGSVCGRGLSGTPVSTIGFERSANRAFSLDDEATFLAFMLRETPPRPPGADEIRAANMAGHVAATSPA